MSLLFLFRFFSTWAFIIHLVSPWNTYYLAVLVFTVGMLLNVKYIPMYTYSENVLRVPYEIIFHIYPLFMVSLPRSGKEKKESVAVVVIALLAYVSVFRMDYILSTYDDPLAGFKDDK
jgi:hypothetical protein